MGLNIGKKYDARVTIWEILKNEKGAKSVRAKFTTSGKNMDGQWETDLSGYINFKGEAATQMRKVYDDKEGVSFHKTPLRIQIDNGSVYQTRVAKKDANGNQLTNRDGKPFYTYYTNVDVFSFTFADNTNNIPANVATGKKDSSFVNIPDGIDEELPFA